VLLPFIAAIRKHLWIITGIALDVAAFKNLPSHYYEMLGDDPFYTAFLRQLLEIMKVTQPEDKLSMICDDEELMALPMYKLYRRVKLVDPGARDKLKSLTFGDDEWMYGLQAADFVSSIIRMEAGKRFLNAPNDFEKLFKAVVSVGEVKAHPIKFSYQELATKPPTASARSSFSLPPRQAASPLARPGPSHSPG
jgi:hypothetical protein